MPTRTPWPGTLASRVSASPRTKKAPALPSRSSGACAAWLSNGSDRDVWYDPRTPQEVKHGLECARAQRRRVRIFYGDAKSGRDRLATQDVVGFVGWAGWQLPHPILLAERHQHLGPRICELEVVRILDLDPAGAFSKYQHPRYSLPEFSTVSCSDSAQPDRVTLAADGVPLFECTNKAQATRWISFFKGTTHVPPKQPI